jgi:hypothetical protein
MAAILGDSVTANGWRKTITYYVRHHWHTSTKDCMAIQATDPSRHLHHPDGSPSVWTVIVPVTIRSMCIPTSTCKYIRLTQASLLFYLAGGAAGCTGG